MDENSYKTGEIKTDIKCCLLYVINIIFSSETFFKCWYTQVPEIQTITVRFHVQKYAL